MGDAMALQVLHNFLEKRDAEDKKNYRSEKKRDLRKSKRSNPHAKHRKILQPAKGFSKRRMKKDLALLNPLNKKHNRGKRIRGRLHGYEHDSENEYESS